MAVLSACMRPEAMMSTKKMGCLRLSTSVLRAMMKVWRSIVGVCSFSDRARCTFWAGFPGSDGVGYAFARRKFAGG